jgi:arylsulfatase A-like enzyme
VALAIWFGLVSSLLEVAILVGWIQIDGSAVLGALQMNRHFLWMIPVSQIVIFQIIGIPTAFASFFNKDLAQKIALYLGCSLAWFSLFSMVKGLHTLACVALAIGLTSRIVPRLLKHSGGLQKLVQYSLPLMFLGVGALALVSFDALILKERRQLAALPAAAPDTPNVLLIVLDTVRADRLSAYGYNRDTTPNLRKLAQRGILFQDARSAAPWTLPSHASMFTGRWPHELGLEDGRTLDRRFPTLAEAMTERGYATSGFVGNTYFCNSWFGLGRGFLHYEDCYEENILISPAEALRCTALGRWVMKLTGFANLARPEVVHIPKDAARIKVDFLKWIDETPGRPFFTFLNYIDAHDPYQPPFGFNKHFGLTAETDADLNMLRNWHLVNKNKLDARQVQLVNDTYDDCLLGLDEQIGALLDGLESRGKLKDTIVVLTSDHGELFGERKLFGHGGSLYKPEVHVPLLISGPAGIPASTQVSTTVSLRDLASTILDLAGQPSSRTNIPGRSLQRFWNGENAGTEEPFLYEVDATMKIAKTAIWPPAQRGPMAALHINEHVYIRDALGKEELFDLKSDPVEAQNLVNNPESTEILKLARTRFDAMVPANRGRH